MALSAAATSTILRHAARAEALPLYLIDSTVRAATFVAAVPTTPVAISAAVISLFEGVVTTMFVAKLKGIALAVGITMVLVSGASRWHSQERPAIPREQGLLAPGSCPLQMEPFPLTSRLKTTELPHSKRSSTASSKPWSGSQRKKDQASGVQPAPKQPLHLLAEPRGAIGNRNHLGRHRPAVVLRRTFHRRPGTPLWPRHNRPSRRSPVALPTGWFPPRATTDRTSNGSRLGPTIRLKGTSLIGYRPSKSSYKACSNGSIKSMGA